MKVTILAVGKLRAPHFAAAADAYAARLRHYVSLDAVEVRDARSLPPGEARAREGAALQAAVPSGSTRVVLDERGALVSSAQLAGRLERDAARGAASWSFLVGGAEGHSDDTRASADWLWSLSPLTFPHELARVLLLEQIYRAMTILRGTPYHRA